MSTVRTIDVDALAEAKRSAFRRGLLIGFVIGGVVVWPVVHFLAGALK